MTRLGPIRLHTYDKGVGKSLSEVVKNGKRVMVGGIECEVYSLSFYHKAFWVEVEAELWVVGEVEVEVV